ncbi:hypothetical protein NL676_038261 [Syzygium grande]|nr:hypothetical protein NL676_038261 [Syzygium grande]
MPVRCCLTLERATGCLRGPPDCHSEEVEAVTGDGHLLEYALDSGRDAMEDALDNGDQGCVIVHGNVMEGPCDWHMAEACERHVHVSSEVHVRRPRGRYGRDFDCHLNGWDHAKWRHIMLP